MSAGDSRAVQVRDLCGSNGQTEIAHELASVGLPQFVRTSAAYRESAPGPETTARFERCTTPRR